MCSVIGATEYTARDELGDQLRREGSPRTRHFGAPDVSCIDVLVRGERPALRHVAVPNRLPVLGEVGLKRRREIEVREPEPRGGIRGEDARRRGGREHEVLPDLDGSERLVAAA